MFRGADGQGFSAWGNWLILSEWASFICIPIPDVTPMGYSGDGKDLTSEPALAPLGSKVQYGRDIGRAGGRAKHSSRCSELRQDLEWKQKLRSTSLEHDRTPRVTLNSFLIHPTQCAEASSVPASTCTMAR